MVQRNGGMQAKSAGKTVFKPVKNKAYTIKAKTLSGAVKAMNARDADEWGKKSVPDARTATQEAKDALQDTSDQHDVDTDHGRKKGTIINVGIR